MSDKVSLVLTDRQTTGKKVASLRRDGLVPAVVYGSEFKPRNVQFSQQEAQRIVAAAGRHTPIELRLDGKTRTSLIKNVAYAPARRDIMHISFQAVRADEVVTTEVPLILIGVDDSQAAKAGLIILPALDTIEIRAKVADLPEKIEIDASQLVEHGDKLTLVDAQVPSGTEIVDFDPEITVATVYEPAALEAKNAAADKQADDERAAKETITSETPTEDETTDQPVQSAEETKTENA
jgi:large subunit ribosomal protein L25